MYVFSCNLPAICTFGRMTGIFYVLLREHGAGTDTEIRVSTCTDPGEEKLILKLLLRRLEPGTFRSRVRGSNH